MPTITRHTYYVGWGWIVARRMSALELEEHELEQSL
jgi:hypothetical protein